VTIPAGGAVSATHENIAQLYDFESAGTGTFSFTPNTVFQVTNADSSVQSVVDTLRVSSTGPTVDINVISDVKRRDLTVSDKRAVVNCNTSESTFISASWVSVF
jgi:deuterolysin